MHGPLNCCTITHPRISNVNVDAAELAAKLICIFCAFATHVDRTVYGLTGLPIFKKSIVDNPGKNRDFGIKT